LWQPWDHECHLMGTHNPERGGARRAQTVAIPSGLRQKQSPAFIPGLPKLNPGLKLANTFGVPLQLLAAVWYYSSPLTTWRELKTDLRRIGQNTIEHTHLRFHIIWFGKYYVSSTSIF
ncbi:MAG TPA: hypothetical protein VFH91_05485, partial [Pyrinomonadaceae bacterium]|nr:hypothetical protein [Pyrinomonadaceae bacterium]